MNAQASIPLTVDLKAEYEASGVTDILNELENELVGLHPVKQRLREIAALLIVERARKSMGLSHEPPTLHMSFTGNPGTGKTTLALRMANILHRLGYIRKGHLVSVTRDDLVGQYIGHTAPKTKEVLKRAMGGVLLLTRPIISIGPIMNATTDKKRSRFSCKSWKTTARILWLSLQVMQTGWKCSSNPIPVSAHALRITLIFRITAMRNY